MSANEHADSEYIGKMRKKLKELTNRKMSPSDAYNDHCVGKNILKPEIWRNPRRR